MNFVIFGRNPFNFFWHQNTTDMKLPKSLDNSISLIGAIIAVVSLVIMAFLVIVSLFLEEGGAYTGLFTYIIMPALLVLGLILIPVGMWLKIRRVKKSGQPMSTSWRVIDFNQRSHRNAVLIFGFGTLLFVMLSSIGSYEAYHYTESNEFCGETCHKVMSPEYTTYQESPHARVGCVECHVGAGATWYVKSKLSGLYQVYSVLTNKYPHPIETPVHSLRPARETCQQCHWPEQFYPNQLVNERHFLADSANSEWNIHLRMRIGSDHRSGGLAEGIHWHINPNIQVDYIPATDKREDIPWVRYINLATGDTTIYMDSENPLDEETLSSAVPRTMDCIDCHNRPSHRYKTPQDFTDRQIAAGNIPKSLPYFKQAAMQVMFSESFTNLDTDKMTINDRIKEYSETEYPDILATQKDSVEKAIVGLLDGFERNIFPYMQASWDAYPDHIGHIEFNGCFRCHNNQHVSESGKVISQDCNLCHTILQQGPPDNPQVAQFNQSLEFEHPVKLKKGWKEGLCTDCHRYLYE